MIDTIDFGAGIGGAAVTLGALLRWEGQFGYALSESRANLDALRDGFVFNPPAGARGRVLELLNADTAYREDPAWLLDLLAIAAEHSRHQLALGVRFFTVLSLPQGSVLEGVRFESLAVPFPFRSSSRTGDPFDR